MKPMESMLTVPLFCSEFPTLLCNLYCSAFLACLFAWFIPIIFWLKWQMGHKHNECFSRICSGIVEISTCQGINDSRLSVVCEAFFKCCVARRSLDEAEAVWQPQHLLLPSNLNTQCRRRCAFCHHSSHFEYWGTFQFRKLCDTSIAMCASSVVCSAQFSLLLAFTP